VHGPAWHFVLWGLYHGVGLVLCATYRQIPGVGAFFTTVFTKEPAAAWLLTQAFRRGSAGWCSSTPVPEALQMARLLLPV